MKGIICKMTDDKSMTERLRLVLSGKITKCLKIIEELFSVLRLYRGSGI